MIQKGKNKDDLLKRIEENNNNFNPEEIKSHLNSSIFTNEELARIIPPEIVETIPGYKQPVLTLGDPPDEIPTGFTEVYFWGIPGSGKTCALSGILSYANKEGLLETKSGPGFLYMNQLKNIFRKPIGFLPSATPVEVTQFLPFLLKDNKEKKNPKKHPIALIELSGEIFRCYLLREANLPFPDQNHKKTFETLETFLAGPNRKIHFFVVDLSMDLTTTDIYGMCQDDYLGAAKMYFEKNKVFDKTTDAIYIIATKSDLLDCDESARDQKAAELLRHNYASFIGVLKDVCKTNRINDDSVLKVIPFSLGEVFFNFICRYDMTSSSQIVKILQQITAKLQGGNFFMDFFNK